MSTLINKKYAFITEPAWFETSIPDWVLKDNFIVISDSDTVLLSALNKKIEAIALNIFLSKKDIFVIDSLELKNERKAITDLGNELQELSYLSSLLQGISFFTAFSIKIHLALERIIANRAVDEIILVKGARYGAMPFETPRGGFLAHFVLTKLCQIEDIKYSTKYHQLKSFEACKKSKRYDKYFLATAEKKFTVLRPNNKDDVMDPVLFLYCYEMCQEDLEPALKKFKNAHKGIISPWAPSEERYHFNFLNCHEEKSNTALSKSDQVNHKFKKAVKALLNPELFLALDLNKILVKLTKNFLQDLKDIDFIAQGIIKEVKKNNIHTVFLTAFPSPLQSSIARFLLSSGIEVKMRQHGTLTDSFFHERCYVEGSTYIANSPKVIPSSYPGDIKNLEFLPRIKIKTSETPVRSKPRLGLSKILITDDLFFDSADFKVGSILFLEQFFKLMPDTYQYILRSHPRYGAYSVLSRENAQFITEDSKIISASESLSSVSMCIIPYPALTSLACDAINLNVPVVFYIPETLRDHFSAAEMVWNFPLVASMPEDLADIASEINDSSQFVNKILDEQKEWLDSFIGKSDAVMMQQTITDNNCQQQIDTFTPWDYFKIKARTHLASLYNEYIL